VLAGPRALPPPPHDPSERVLLARVDGWELRDFPRSDERWAYLGTHGFAHLQLWNHDAGVSVLTPSRLTGDRFEAFPIAGWKWATESWERLCATVTREHHVTLLRPQLLRVALRYLGT
jgi:hypothetical protein